MTETRETAIVGGRVVPVEGEPVEGGTVLLRDGKIAAVTVDLNRWEMEAISEGG